MACSSTSVASASNWIVSKACLMPCGSVSVAQLALFLRVSNNAFALQSSESDVVPDINVGGLMVILDLVNGSRIDLDPATG